MNMLRFFTLGLMALSVRLAAAGEAPITSPTADLRAWAVEQMPGGKVATEAGALVITDAAGSTVWLREKLTLPQLR